MYSSQRIKLKLNEEEKKLINKVSYYGNRLYNEMLEYALEKNDYSLRNLMREIYRKIRGDRGYLLLNKDSLFSIAKRINQAFLSYQAGRCGKPRFHSLKHKWFSLLFYEDLEIKGRRALVRIGKTNLSLQLYERVGEYKRILGYRITKEINKYYLILDVEADIKPLEKTGRVIAIDPNHTNLFMAIDNEGISYEMENLKLIDYFDSKISEVKRKRSLCYKEEVKKEDGCIVKKTSRRYEYLTQIIYKLYEKRKKQLKDALYIVAKAIAKRYDVIAMGNYYPRKELASNSKMEYRMLNETVIGAFRDTLEYVCKRSGKKFIKVAESGTTARCFWCNHWEKKAPDVRSFTCPNCLRSYNRDINSAINIGIKSQILSSQDYVGIDLTKPTYTLSYTAFTGLVAKEIK